MPISALEIFLGGLEKKFSSKNPLFSNFSVENSDSQNYVIFFLLDIAMLEQHFRYLGLFYALENFLGGLEKILVKKSTFFRLFSRKF